MRRKKVIKREEWIVFRIINECKIIVPKCGDQIKLFSLYIVIDTKENESSHGCIIIYGRRIN